MIDKRIFEIDFLKVIAIILMIMFHIVYDLNEFYNIEITYFNGFWYWIGKIAGFLFIFLSGINSGFSKKPIKRGIIVLMFGIVITIVTFIFLRNQYVRFGILHLLGTCMILSPYLKKLNNLILLTIAILIIALYNSDNALYESNLMIFLGNVFGGKTIDYYPLFPYLSIFIYGLLMYKMFYSKGHSILNLNIQNKIIYVISKYSLFIYLIHQPIIVASLLLFKYFLNN